MPEFVIPPPARVTVPVARQAGVFPVRRIYCVGRNYAAHAREMGNDAREAPFFFQKPADAIVPDGSTIPYPRATANLHHEVELVLAIGRGGADIDAREARVHVYGLAVGIDLTRRDLQNALKDAGRPWEAAKAFDASAPIGAIRALGDAPLPRAGRIHLSVDGKPRQEGDIADMIWSAEEVVSQLSRLFRLEPGDLIYTGTPAGVGPLQPGNRVLAGIDDLDSVSITIDIDNHSHS